MLALVENYVRTNNPDFNGDYCRIAFHVYGKNGVRKNCVQICD